jgi:hypothetical protein
MKKILYSPTVLVVLLLGALWLLPAVPLVAGEYAEDGSNPEYVYVKGMVHSLAPADHTLTVRPRKGPGITMVINPDTELVGVKSLEGIQVKQVIKAWYKPGKKGNDALKIVRLPDLGC